MSKAENSHAASEEMPIHVLNMLASPYFIAFPISSTVASAALASSIPPASFNNSTAALMT
jgi:hypothetical protein